MFSDKLPAVAQAVLGTLAQAHVASAGLGGYPETIAGSHRGVPVRVTLGNQAINVRESAGVSSKQFVGLFTMEIPVATRGFVARSVWRDAMPPDGDVRFVLARGFHLEGAPRALAERVFDEAVCARLGAVVEACSAPRTQFALAVDADRVHLRTGAPADAESLAYVLDTAVDIATRASNALAASGVASFAADPEVVRLRTAAARQQTRAVALLVVGIAAFVALAVAFVIATR